MSDTRSDLCKLGNNLFNLYKKLHEKDPKLACDLYKLEYDLMQVIVDRNVEKKYSNSYKETGILGILAQILHKSKRLKNLIFNESDQSFRDSGYNFSVDSFKEGIMIDNGVAAHLADMINYSKLCLIEMQDESILRDYYEKR